MHAIRLDFRGQPAGYLGSNPLRELVPSVETARKFAGPADALAHVESRSFLPLIPSVVALPSTPEESARPRCN